MIKLPSCDLEGDRRRALAETGGPVVVTWCVTLCLMGPVVTLGWVTAGNSETIAAKGVEEVVMDWEMPLQT